MTRLFLLTLAALSLGACGSPCEGAARTWYGTFDRYAAGVFALDVLASESPGGNAREGVPTCSAVGEIDVAFEVGACGEYNRDDLVCELTGAIDGYHVPYGDGPLIAGVDGNLRCDCGSQRIGRIEHTALLGGELTSWYGAGGQLWLTAPEIEVDFDRGWSAD